MDKEIIFDNVKYEKQKAMARFNMFQRMKKLLQVFELLVLLVLISWSTKKIPLAVDFSGKFLLELINCLKKPHIVFVMVIFIVLVLVFLCKENVNESNDDDFEKDYDVQNNDFTKLINSPLVKTNEIPKEEIEIIKNEMQIVVANNDDGDRDAVEVAIEEAAKRIRRFERTQSEKLRRDIGVRKTKELRRSETKNSRAVVRGGGERRIVESEFNTVDHLSNEEFKLAVDDFINKHRVFFKEQKVAEFNFH
ncbi:hypothetical protein LIER_09060 [Lithospermum erythrorhizon]|uniref:Transmembrane protein n=1 Tax=Lithospermum erythrorhizon TaxID=34254 RepID=A0AAV3PIN3_LITER